MKPPARVKISPHSYDVSGDERRLDDIDSAALGVHLGPKSAILIRPGQSPSQERDSTLHEILHAVIYQTPLYANTESWSNKEEELVQAIAPRLLAVLRDNPKLVAYLTEGS